MVNQIRCELGFHELTGKKLSSFSTGINEGVANNADVFDPAKTPALPLTHSLMLSYIVMFDAAFNAYDKGGIAQKPAYDTATEVIMACLNKFVVYVDTIAAGDPKIIIKAGFKPTHELPNQATVAPGQPKEVKVEAGDVSGVFYLECETFGLNHHYICFAVEGSPFPPGMQTDAAGMFIIPATFTNKVIINLTNGRKKTFAGLTKGVEYYFYYVVINAAGVSALSVVVSKMCA